MKKGIVYFFNTILILLFLFEHDSLEILEINRAVLEKYGYEEKDLIGKSILQIFEPSDFDKVKQEIIFFSLGPIKLPRLSTKKERRKIDRGYYRL